jgi:hypothetical protein
MRVLPAGTRRRQYTLGPCDFQRQRMQDSQCLSRRVLELVPADECAAKRELRQMDIRTALVADDEPTVWGRPGECSLDYPPVTAQLLARLDTSAGDARRDTPLAASNSAMGEVIRLVAVQLRRPLAGTAPKPRDRVDRIQHRLQHPGVVPVGRGEQNRERNAVPVHEQVPLRAWSAPVRRIRTSFLAPLSPARWPSPAPPATNRCDPGCRAGQAGGGAAGPRRRPAASRAVCTSTCCRSRSPAHVEGTA